MTGLIVLDAVDTNSTARGARRARLERTLRTAGYTVVPFDSPLVGDQLRAAVARLVDDADDAQRARLAVSVSASADDGLDDNYWGPAPDAREVSRAVFDDLADQFTQRRQVIANGVSRDEAAKLLGVASQSITSRLLAHKLVGLKAGREWRLPPWQFDPDRPDGILPDLDKLQAAFPGGPVNLSQWMMRAQPDFDGRTPLQEMRIHGSEPVIALARTLTATAW